ncbi:hypothetical protein A2397_03990 [Candidatus Amesbacteria bacterium RIFOXYB1_FULL_44_23]|uniref:Sortase n=1 Tax=Candidatus Amesbacteria bacterium RIFOXYB1_FULL_44_23 TaxID=1797263 RepID=A0A1F4ZT34_9BACT|nr:MAG: hypothetical protein A2397_03990 [Candidatus Amesbacteria bacterium RIFOXYB1_FULL_44_23]
MKTGVVYQDGTQKDPVRVSVLVRILKTMALALSAVGSLMILVSLTGLVFVYIPLGVAEVRYGFSKTQLARLTREMTFNEWEKQEKEKESVKKLKGQLITEIRPEWPVPDSGYSIYIPKIFALSKVIGNVNADKPQEYLKALKLGVAEAAGLGHPGEVGTTYLFAHSVGSRWDFARYNAVFYLLDKLVTGDAVELVYQGRLYKYEVAEKEVVSATDTKYLVPQTVSEKLIMQTCYPPGTTWKRLVVVAKRIS